MIRAADLASEKRQNQYCSSADLRPISDVAFGIKVRNE